MQEISFKIFFMISALSCSLGGFFHSSYSYFFILRLFGKILFNVHEKAMRSDFRPRHQNSIRGRLKGGEKRRLLEILELNGRNVT